METTDEESSSTGHTETTVDSREMSPSVRVTLQTPVQVGFAFALALTLLTLDSGKITTAL